MMATVMTVPGVVPSGMTRSDERERLISELLDAVKQCQIRFGGRTELATESDEHVAFLCSCLEAALTHGLRNKPLSKNNNSAFKQMSEMVSTSLNLGRSETNQHPAFWPYVTEHLTRHEYERYLLLKQVWTDTGRGRAWLRSSLNEHSLERYLHCLLGNPQHIAIYYEDWALLLDQERSSTLPTMARGLGSVLFAISIDKVELNQPAGFTGRVNEPLVATLPLSNTYGSSLSRSEPIIGAVTQSDNISIGSGSISSSGSKRRPESRRKKKGPVHIISFDDDGDGNYGVDIPQQKSNTIEGVCRRLDTNSAPATCPSSPVAITITQPPTGIGEESNSNSSSSNASATGSTIVSNVNFAPPTEGKTPEKNNHLETSSKDTVDQTCEVLSAPQITADVSDEDCSPSPNPQKADQLPCPAKRESRLTSLLTVKLQTLTPVNNLNVGELIPVSANEEAHSEEDSLSVPSYSEDMDCAAAALLATQKLLQNTTLDYTPPEQPSGSARTKSKVELPSHVNGEVQDALLALLTRKEELHKENRNLRRALEEGQEIISTLQAELAETSRVQSEKIERIESRLQALNRENELLKHQLRKYVGAVQMLRRDGTQAHEMLSQLAGGNVPGDPPDYHNEAREYEKKLIQVAEMHGELMEFNDRLHRTLQAKEAALRRLRDELVDLRGPLPDEPATSDDDANSVTSDYDGGSICTAARALVNIWVPSAFLTGGSSDVHHVYQVFIRIRDDEWNIYRRYAQFYALHKDLKKQDAVVGTFDFPPKKALGNKDARFVEERRRRLQHYLRCVMNHLVQTNAELAATPDKDLLVHLVPFFGELCNAGDERNRRKRASSRNPFTRLTRVNPDGPSSHSSPQYTGL